MKQPIKIGVAHFTSAGINEDVIQNIESLVTNDVGRYDTFEVVSFADIQKMLVYEKQKQMIGCESDVNCLAQIGGALGVDKLITGSVGYLGETYIVSLQLIDVRKSLVESRAQVRAGKGREQQLVDATDMLSRQLVIHLLPDEGVRTAELLKWSGILTLASTVLGAGMFFQAKGKEKYYGEIFKEVHVVQGSEGNQFRDEQTQSQYKERLDGLKNAGLIDGKIANGSFLSAGTFLLSTALLFYLNRPQSNEADKNESPLMPNLKADFALRLTGGQINGFSETPPELGPNANRYDANAAKYSPRVHKEGVSRDVGVALAAKLHLLSGISVYGEGEIRFTGPMQGASLTAGIDLSLKKSLRLKQKWDFSVHGGGFFQVERETGSSIGGCYEYSFLQGCIDSLNVFSHHELETGIRSDFFESLRASIGIRTSPSEIIDFYHYATSGGKGDRL